MKRWHGVCVILFFNLLSYHNSLQNGFVGFDDNILLDENPAFSSRHVMLSNMGLTSLEEGDRSREVAYWGVPDQILRILFGRNLRFLSHFLDYHLFGMDLWGHHLMNVVWHVLAACAAFAAASMILNNQWGGLAAALFFSLHPVQTESVAYLAGRRDILLGFFYLLGFYFWLSYRRENRKPLAVWAGVYWLLAIATKESAVTLPVSIVAYEVFTRFEGLKIRITLSVLFRQVREELSHYRQAVRVITFFGAVLGGLLVYQQLNFGVAKAVTAYGHEVFWYGGTALSNWATVPKILIHALGLIIWPQKLTGDYSYNAIPALHSLLEPGAIFPLALLAGLGALAWQAAKKRPILGFAVVWTAVTYIPHLPLIPAYHNQQVFAEHWLYLPLFGPALIFGYIFVRGQSMLPRLSAVAAAVMLAAFIMRSTQRNLDWKDDLTFWTRTAQDVPLCARARNNLGLACFRRDMVPEAFQELKKALEIDPGWAVPYHNLGQVFAFMGRVDDAIKAFQRTIEINPFNPNAWASLVTLHIARGDLQQAEAVYLAGRVKYSSPVLFNSAASLEFLRGRYDRAERIYKVNLSIRPGFTMMRSNLGALYLETGRPAEAERELIKSLQTDPNQPGARANLGLVYGKMGKLGPAAREIREAQRLGFPIIAALIYQGIIFRDCRLWQKSLTALMEARRLAPSLETYSHLGQTYAAMGDWRRAEDCYRQAIALGPLARDYYLLAKAFRDQGRIAESGQALRRALEIQPKYELALKMLKSMKIEMRR
ncbi:MAG: tetratricopeptide repeat protein [bacterium]